MPQTNNKTLVEFGWNVCERWFFDFWKNLIYNKNNYVDVTVCDWLKKKKIDKIFDISFSRANLCLWMNVQKSRRIEFNIYNEKIFSNKKKSTALNLKTWQ